MVYYSRKGLLEANINNFNPVLHHIVRSNHDVRFLTSSTHEMYYDLKYVVINQNKVDNIATLTLSSYTKKLHKEKYVKNERIETQLVYGK